MPFYLALDGADICYGPETREACLAQLEPMKAQFMGREIGLFMTKDEQKPKRKAKSRAKGIPCKWCGQRIPKDKRLSHKAFELGIRGIWRNGGE